jgi:FKBP-type peptidyl-prolyl cis-trans isomerase SlyD
MKIAKDTVATIHYTLTDANGDLLDSSRDGEPLEYLHGRNYLLAKLEEQLTGKQKGDCFETDISAKDGYGEYDESLVSEVPITDFEPGSQIEEGMAFQAETEEGYQIVVVKKVTPETITVDANHELAGKDLHFNIEVIDVRAATEDELKSGRVGGGCGCGGCGGDCDGECESDDGSCCGNCGN